MATAEATPGIILGDSIGVGLSMAAGLPRMAHNSVSIRSADALAQLRKAPPDSIAFLSLGTNDAVGSIRGIDGSVNRIMNEAERSPAHLVWIGPPCVLKPWNDNVVKLDQILRARLTGRITYVSIADEEMCRKSLHASDGVHFTMQGYAMIWQRARAAAGGDIEAAHVAPSVALGKRHRRRHGHARFRA